MRDKLADLLHGVAQKIDTRPTRADYWRKGYWVTAEGEIIAVTDIPDDHLLNIACFLFRAAEAKADREAMKYLRMPGPQGDMAQLAWDQALDRLAEYGATDRFATHPFYPFLSRELIRRGLWPQFIKRMPGHRDSWTEAVEHISEAMEPVDISDSIYWTPPQHPMSEREE